MRKITFSITIKKILSELSPIWLLIISIILFILLIGLGFVHLFLKSTYNLLQFRFWKGLIYFFWYWIRVVVQLWRTIQYFCLHIAISIDLFGNVICGEAIEDLVTTEENTLFGDGEITISTSTGELESKNKLNESGLKFSNFLSKILGKNHCIESYKRHLYNKEFKIN
jgi:hypothetical protein